MDSSLTTHIIRRCDKDFPSKEEFKIMIQLNEEYRTLFNECAFCFDINGDINLPQKWSFEKYLENMRHCIKNKVKMYIFKEWQERCDKLEKIYNDK